MRRRSLSTLKGRRLERRYLDRAILRLCRDLPHWRVDIETERQHELMGLIRARRRVA